MSRLPALAMPIALAAGGAFVLVQASTIAAAGGYSNIGPAFFPTLIGGLLLALAPLLAWGAWQDRAGTAAEQTTPPARVQLDKLAWIAAGVTLGALAIERAGYVVAMSAAFLLAAQAFPSQRAGLTALRNDALVSILFSVTTWFAFTLGLGLRLPAGWLNRLPGA